MTGTRSDVPIGRSSSLVNPTYWWYRARSGLLERVFASELRPGMTVLDIGSADGPSVAWMDDMARRVPLDVDPAGLPRGGLCASALQLPLRDGSVDAVSAFDVIEHFANDAAMTAEIFRVLRPGGRLFAAVPAYQWAWSSHDVAAGHHRRYTRRRLVALLRGAGFRVDRATYAFAGTFPFFAADRLRSRLSGRDARRAATAALPHWLEATFLRLSRLDAAVLARADLPFGSSVFVAATRR